MLTTTFKQKTLSATLAAALALGCAGTVATGATISSPDTADAATTWQQSGNRWWYQKGNSYSTGWDKIGGAWYYFDNAGWMQTGWQKVGGSWYYLNAGGDMATGWKAIGGTWYYLNPAGDMATGWKKVGNTWYYLNSSGAMVTGWKKIGNSWYYLSSSGAMTTGWNNVEGTWYYHDTSGAMQANKWIGDYYVGADGAMATGTWIGSYYVGPDGKWMPKVTGNETDYVEQTEIDWTKNARFTELDDGTLQLWSISTDFGTDIVIPDQIGGKYVSEVVLTQWEYDAFAGLNSYNFITSIDFSKATHLRRIELDKLHFLTKINLSGCDKLESFLAQYTHIKRYDFTACNSLTSLSISQCHEGSDDKYVMNHLKNPAKIAKYPNLKYTDPTVEAFILPNHGKFIHEGETGIAGVTINNKGVWVNLNNYPVYNLPDPSICEWYPAY